VSPREGIAKVEDGEDDGEKFPIGDHQCDSEGGTLGGELVHVPNAAILGEHNQQ